MSIAVSAVIMPSRLLRATFAAYGAACLGAGILVLGQAGSFRHAGLLAACCFGCAGAACRALARAAEMRRIDISGDGKLRVTVQQDGSETEAQTGLATLLPGSTVWPSLMVLLLRDEKGAVSALSVLPDSVNAAQFRALAVAVRAIGGGKTRPGDFFMPYKIF